MIDSVEPTLDEKKQSLNWARDRYQDEKLDYVVAAAVGHGFGLAAMRAEVDKLKAALRESCTEWEGVHERKKATLVDRIDQARRALYDLELERAAECIGCGSGEWHRKNAGDPRTCSGCGMSRAEPVPIIVAKEAT